jgi:hypothetical protein
MTIPMRRIASFVLVTIFLTLEACAEVYIEPTVFDGRVGPLGIHGYENRTKFTWSRGSEWTSLEVQIPFHALVAGLTLGSVMVGALVFLRRRTSRP